MCPSFAIIAIINMKTESLNCGKGPLKECATVPSLSLYPSDLPPSFREKKTLSQLGVVTASAALHACELQQLSNDLERTRHVPLGKRTLGRVSDGSREEVLGAELQLNVWMLARLSAFLDGVDQRDG